MSSHHRVPYDAEIYDLFLSSSLFGDIEWYREKAIASGGPVLELGAGTGRTLLPIAEAGIEIDGLDLDAGMLERLEKKLQKGGDDLRRRVRLFHADMQDFSLDRQYRLIQIPYRAFLHNVTREAQMSTLRACHEHLLPGGTLALNAFHPSLSFMAANAGNFEGVWRWGGSVTTEQGETILLQETNRYDTPSQQVHSILRYEFFNSDGMLTHTKILPLHLAYLYPGDYRELLGEAGFENIEIYGGFGQGPLKNDGDELVVVGRRPG